MSDPHGHDPDPAALDELLRVFGSSPTPDRRTGSTGETDGSADDAADAGDTGEDGHGDDEPAGDDDRGAGDTGDDDRVDDDTGDGGPAGDVTPGGPVEIVIVEQEPMEPPVDPTPTPPTIIRIDDFSGSVVVEEAGTATPATGGPSTPEAPVAGDGPPERVVIEDADLPDAVYVQGELAGSGDRSIVFIEDDETGDTVAPEAERDVRRGIEPRLRDRRAAVKRAMGRKRLRWAVFGAIVLLVGVGALAVLGSGLFAIDADKVEVYGAVYTDEEQLAAVIDDLVGTPTLRADIQGAEEALEAIPWVDEARVRVSFPHSATIEIREREAWTTYQGPDQRYRVLDREGRVLAVLDGYPIAYLLIMGPDPVDLEPGQFAPQGYAAASELAKNLTPSIRGQVVFVSVTADGSQLSLFLDDGTEVRFGEARDLFDKLLRLETVLAANPEREPGVIDVSTSEVTL
jgi:cell division protein FtsQ